MDQQLQDLITMTEEELQAKSGKKVGLIEQSWAKFKYLVLEYSPQTYLDIRQLLKNKSEDLSQEYIDLLAFAFDQPRDPQQQINALDHVWGYFKSTAKEDEKETYLTLKDGFLEGSYTIMDLKNFLYQLTLKYQDKYLMDSYFFVI